MNKLRFNKPGRKRLPDKEYAEMSEAKKKINAAVKGKIEYTVLDTDQYPDGRVVVKFPKRMDTDTNSYLEDKIMKPLISDGYKYFFYDMTEAETINSATLRIILLSQQPLNSTMGRIMFIFDNKEASKSTLWEILNKTNFVREQTDTERTIFGRWNTIEEAMAWIPKDIARRTEYRSKPSEEV